MPPVLNTFWFQFFLIIFSSFHAFSKGNELVEIDSGINYSGSLRERKIFRDYYLELGKDSDFSIEERLKALNIAEKMALGLDKQDKLLGIYGHRGHLYLSKGNPAMAIKAFSDGFKYLDRESKDKKYLERQGWFLISYGNLLYKFEQYQGAMFNFKHAFEKFSQAETRVGMSVALNNIGLSLLGVDNLDSAFSYFTKAYLTRKSLGNTNLMAHSLIYLSKVYLLQNQNRKADSLLIIAKAYIDQTKDKDLEIDILIGWAEIAMSKEKYGEANDYLNKINSDKKSFNSLNWIIEKVNVLKEIEQIDSVLIYAEKGIYLGNKLGNIDVEILFLESKLFALTKDPVANFAAIQKNTRLFRSLIEEESKVKNKVLKQLFKANQEYINTKVQNEKLKLEDYRKTEVIALQTNSIILISIIIIILIIGFLIILHLYKEIKKSKKILQTINTRTRIASDSMAIAIISINSRNRIRFINKAGHEYLKTIGIDKVNLGLDLLRQIEAENRREEWKTRLKNLASEGNTQSINFEINAGVKHFYIYNLTRIINSEGNYSGGIFTINDITEIQQTNIELAKKSSELKTANDAKDRMLSLLAHDLKEGVISSLELTRHLKQGLLSVKEEKESVGLLEASLSKTSSLLFKTLEWVKDQNSQTKNRRRNVVLLKLVRDVERGLRDNIQAKGLDIIYNVDLDLKVNIDSELIRSVLRNILTNAIKFSDKKNSKIEIYTEQDDNSFILLHIKDFGMGMNSKELKKLLHLDYHESKRGSSGEKGTGIGLKLAQELLLSHDSLLQVNSVLNQGSDFYFRLPISKN
ncbi:MAG: PAS domain S-box-containing protein [Arcticibacterium sp.]